jgi:2-furoyl-CoA dehydrogenase large subunit
LVSREIVWHRKAILIGRNSPTSAVERASGRKVAPVEVQGESWVGRSLPRVEDAALLTGRGRYIDDLGVRPGTLHAAILRSPHAHAEIAGIDVAEALAAPGVAAVLTGADIK